MGKEPKDAQSVVSAHNKDAFLAEVSCILSGFRCGSRHESAPEYPHHDRQFLRSMVLWKPKVQI